MFDQDEKILLGNSIPLPEVDIDENINEETVQENALKGYWFATILNRIGESDFKSNYLTVIDDIKNSSPIEEQKRFCYAILEKIDEVHNFEFPIMLEFDNLDQINSLYKFLEFLEYNYEEFICTIWKFLDYDIFPNSIEDFCKRNNEIIIKQIDEQTKFGFYPNKISVFLKTYKREDLIDWFYKASIEARSQILIKKLEEKKK